MGLISTDLAKKLAKAFKAPINSWKKMTPFSFFILWRLFNGISFTSNEAEREKKLKSRFPEFIFPQKIFLLQVLQKIYFCFYWDGRRAEVPEENLFVGFDRELGGARVPHVVGSHPERRRQIKSFFKARFLEVSLFMITENLNSMFLGQIFVYDESDYVFLPVNFFRVRLVQLCPL